MQRNVLLSPCVKICKIDKDSGLCQGCLRTLEEIAAWGRLTNAERGVIYFKLAGRRQQFYQMGSDKK